MKVLALTMGCGQSNSASKTHANDGHDYGSRHGEMDAYVKAPTISIEKLRPVPDDPLTPSVEELQAQNSGGSVDSAKLSNGDVRQRSSSNMMEQDEHLAVKQRLSAGSLNAGQKISDSQLEFFKMLDDKVEGGRDYGSESEASGVFGT